MAQLTNNSFRINRIVALLCVFVLVYLSVFFPFAYFRNDDWWILGNGVLHLPKDWSFAFSPTLFSRGIEQVWFFRPFFKIFTFLFFKTFGYNYYLWLCATLVFTVGAITFTAMSLQLVTGSTQKAQLFVLLFIASLHLHFGSVMWVGEGLMNCPQVFLLAASLYFFSRSLLTQQETFLHAGIGIVFYTLALGFKEAAVFHPVFLTFFLFCEPKLKLLAWKPRIFSLLPYGVVTSFYLIYRLGFLPLNQEYVSQFSVADLGQSLLYLTGALAIPLGGMLVAFYFEGKNLISLSLRSFWNRRFYLLFMLLMIAPYLGHPFFSPGWLLAPGMYLALILALSLPAPSLSNRFFRLTGSLLVLLSCMPILWRLHTIGWWQWHKPQRQLLEIFKNEKSERIDTVAIYHCENPAYPNVGLARVVGTPYGLYEAWRLYHGKEATIRTMSCSQVPDKIDPNSNTLHIKWFFPHLTVLK